MHLSEDTNMERWREQLYLEHSAKGTTWGKHKYIAIKNGRYIYPKDLKKKTSDKLHELKSGVDEKLYLKRNYDQHMGYNQSRDLTKNTFTREGYGQNGQYYNPTGNPSSDLKKGLEAGRKRVEAEKRKKQAEATEKRIQKGLEAARNRKLKKDREEFKKAIEKAVEKEQARRITNQSQKERERRQKNKKRAELLTQSGKFVKSGYRHYVDESGAHMITGPAQGGKVPKNKKKR